MSWLACRQCRATLSRELRQAQASVSVVGHQVSARTPEPGTFYLWDEGLANAAHPFAEPVYEALHGWLVVRDQDLRDDNGVAGRGLFCRFGHDLGGIPFGDGAEEGLTVLDPARVVVLEDGEFRR